MVHQHSPWGDESLFGIWGRRLLTVPALLLLTALVALLLPLALPLALLHDLIRRNQLIAVRCALITALNLTMHSAALLLLPLLWLLAGRWRGAPRARLQTLLSRFELWWASGAFRSVERLFRVTVAVEGLEQLAQGPFILFPRHSSTIDTLLPLHVISRQHGTRLRFVAKRELLWDPMVDVLGHHLPNAFVRRGGEAHGKDINAVAQLMDDLREDEAVVLYPEGTRFTPQKRERVLKKLKSTDPELHTRALALEHTLPPRLGGPLALLSRDSRADVVFMAHVGLERTNRLRDLLSGALLDQRVQVKFWRIPRTAIPEDPQAQVDWLFTQWAMIDQWIDQHRPDKQQPSPKTGP